MENKKRTLTPEQHEKILEILKARFDANMDRHQELSGQMYKQVRSEY